MQDFYGLVFCQLHDVMQAIFATFDGKPISQKRRMLFKYLKLKSWRPFLTLSPSISITSSYSYSSVSSTSHLKIGDVLKKSQKFSHQDVLQFSNLTHDSNPLHFDSQSARDAGFRDCIVHGMLVAALFPRTIASYFVSCQSLFLHCFSSCKIIIWLLLIS